MNFKLNKKLIEPRWEDYTTKKGEKVRLLIKPYPASSSNTIVRNSEGTMEVILSGEEQKKAFCFSLIDAEGIIGDDDKPLPITEEVKGILFDYEEIFQSGIPTFVLQKAKLLQQEIEQKKENLEKN